MMKVKVLTVGLNSKGQRYIKVIIPGVGIVEGTKTMGIRGWVLSEDSAKIRKRDEKQLWVIMDVSWRESMDYKQQA